MILNYIKYPGNKTAYLEIILNLIPKNITRFIEPFGGSGTVSLEVSKLSSIDQILLNDLDVRIYQIHRSFQKGSYEELCEVIDEVWSYGNPREVKEDYYKARTELNAKYFNKSGVKPGFYYYVISTFAINSMMRFGPSGFNQGWGFRGIKSFDLNHFNALKEAYSKIDVSCMDYTLFGAFGNDENTLLFADPPYADKESGTYSFTQEQQTNFLQFIESWKGPVIYTDVLHDKLSPKWNHKILRTTMGMAKPGTTVEHKSEAIYFNFPEKKLTKSLF